MRLGEIFIDFLCWVKTKACAMNMLYQDRNFIFMGEGRLCGTRVWSRFFNLYFMFELRKSPTAYTYNGSVDHICFFSIDKIRC